MRLLDIFFALKDETSLLFHPKRMVLLLKLSIIINKKRGNHSYPVDL